MPAKIHGNLGSVVPGATTNTQLYAAPASRKATGTLTICNQNSADVTVRVAIIPTGGVGAVAPKDYREYDTQLNAKGVLEKSGIPLAAGATVLVWASSGSVAFNLDGIEEDA